MSTDATETVSLPKRPKKALLAAAKPSVSIKKKRVSKVAAPPPPPAVLSKAHQTKQEKVLALLAHGDGATISDLISATGWQQHSVRGFLAGTVKKKLGLTLTSSKKDGDLRRYRIATKRGC